MEPSYHHFSEKSCQGRISATYSSHGTGIYAGLARSSWDRQADLQSSQPSAREMRPREYSLMATTINIRGRKVALTAMRLVLNVSGLSKLELCPGGGGIAG